MSYARSLAIIVAIIFLCPVSALSEDTETKPVRIPLKDVWAYQMPGTRPIVDSVRVNGHASAEGSLMRDIRRALHRSIDDGENALPGFAVAGKGMTALQHAHDVLVDGQNPQSRFAVRDDISLVFYSLMFDPLIHLREIVRRGNKIEISYQIVPDERRNVHEHFAIIPVEKLPPGRYRVRISRLPAMRGKVVPGLDEKEEEWAQRVVCRSFDFELASATSK